MILSKIEGLLLSLFLSVGLLGCQSLTFFSVAFPTSISVSQLQQKSAGSIIYLEGVVKDQAPFLGNAAYLIADETGQVWVLTDAPLPESGQEIKIKGKIEYKPISVGNQDLGEFYVLEIEKLTELPQDTPQEVQPVSNPQPEMSPEAKPSPEFQDLFFPHKQNAK